MILALVIALGAVNPAVTQDNIRATICKPGWATSVRPSKQWAAYHKRKLLRGHADGDPRHYQLDHVVPIEVGGAPKDAANLQLQPLQAAHEKDRLEDSTNRQVCSGAITLEDGQRRFIKEERVK